MASGARATISCDGVPRRGARPSGPSPRFARLQNESLAPSVGIPRSAPSYVPIIREEMLQAATAFLQQEWLLSDKNFELPNVFNVCNKSAHQYWSRPQLDAQISNPELRIIHGIHDRALMHAARWYRWLVRGGVRMRAHRL